MNSPAFQCFRAKERLKTRSGFPEWRACFRAKKRCLERRRRFSYKGGRKAVEHVGVWFQFPGGKASRKLEICPLSMVDRSLVPGFCGVLGPPVVPFYPFLGEGSPTNIDYRKKGTLISRSGPKPLGLRDRAPRAWRHSPVRQASTKSRSPPWRPAFFCAPPPWSALLCGGGLLRAGALPVAGCGHVVPGPGGAAGFVCPFFHHSGHTRCPDV